jgi:Ca-activated chloride channel family protein
LEAAKDAAQAFIQNHRSGRLIGIVAFAGFAELIQAPTTDESALNSAIENLTPARRTAIGSAILRAIDVIAEVDDRVAPSDNVTASSGTGQLTPSDAELSPHIIVLLTDGASNAGPYPLTAANRRHEGSVYQDAAQSQHIAMNCGDFQRGFGNLVSSQNLPTRFPTR